MIQRETSASAYTGTATPRGPVRTCVGCRRRELAVELLRVVAERDGNGDCVLTVDSAGNLPGRGAWLHPDQQCLDTAIRRRAFTRALRITGPPDSSAVVQYYVDKLADKTADRLADAAPAHPATEQVAKNMSTP